MSRYVNREQIRAAQDRRFEEVPVPEWGGMARVRSLTGRERDEFEASVLREKKKGRGRELNLENYRAKLVAISVVDEQGEPILSERDVAWLGEKNAACLQRICDKANELSGLTDADVEELVEDFGSDPSDAPGSA